MRRIQKHPMFPIFLVVFFGYVGFSLAFPIFTPMFLDVDHHFLPANFPIEYRTVMLGCVLAAYPIGQFLGLPLLGELSDHYGRKNVLQVTLCVTFLAYLLSAGAILLHSYWLLLVSRFICGYAEGNFSIAQSTAADISVGHQRVKNFGIINMAAGLGFVIGPIIGGKLADPSIISWFGDDIPFWFSAILALVTMAMVAWQLPETKPKNERDPNHKIHPFSGLVILHRNFSRSGGRGLYLINFLFYFGLFFFYQYFPALLVSRFDYTSSDIANISAYIAVIIAFSQFCIVRPLAKHVKSRHATIFAAFLLAPSLIGLTLDHYKFVIYIALPCAALFMSIATTNLQSVVSHSVSEDMQGEVMGVNYSMQILGEIITSLLGGFLAGYFLISMPLIIGGVIVFTAAIALWMFTTKDLYQR